MLCLQYGKHFTLAAKLYTSTTSDNGHLQYSVGDKALYNDCFCWKLDADSFRHSNPDFTQTFQRVRALTPLLYLISTFSFQI